MLKQNFKSNILQSVFIIIYRILCELYYVYKVSPIYDYSGYTNDAGMLQYCFSWLFIIILILLHSQTLNKKDLLWQYFIMFLFCIKIVPLSVMLGRVEYEADYIFYNFVFWILFIWLYNIMPSFKIFEESFLKEHKRTFNVLLHVIIILFCFAIVYVSGVYTGFRFHTSLFDVYDIRFEQREMSYPTIFRYILAASTILCPIILSYLLDKKNKLLILIFIFLIYLDFSIEGLKSIVFSTILGLILRFFYRSSYRKYFYVILSALFLVLLFINNEIISLAVSLVIWRVFFCTAGMDYEYYTFFNRFEPDYYRNSFLSRLGLESPYGSTSVDIAVGEYFNPAIEGIRANNGLLSEAFANFGMIGCVILPIIIVIYMKLICSFAKNLNEGFICLIAMILTYTIISTFIPTTFLSSGIFFMLIFLLCYRANIKEEGNSVSLQDGI